MDQQKIIHYPQGATPIDPDEMAGLRYKHITTREELNHLEQANIQSGLSWLKRQKNFDLLTEQFIREAHRRLFGDVWKWAGSFRKTEKNIGIDPLYIPMHLRLLLDDVRYWILNETYSAIEIAARFHHKLVAIHLFPNGNGRHARIMADTLLVEKFGLSEIDWSKGYELFNISIRRQLYIDSLRQADKNNYLPLLNFVSSD